MEKNIDIIIDFDGTSVSHAYPYIGKDIGAIPVLRKLITAGHKLILFTMRDKTQLEDAVNWFITNEINLYGIQRNPTQNRWTTSPKAYGQLIIDDAAIFAPLKFDPTISNRPFIDWNVMEKELTRLKLINVEPLKEKKDV